MKTKLTIVVFALLGFMANAQTGNVGVGTSSPTEKLEVNGNYKDSAFSTTWKSQTNGGTYYTADYIVIYNGTFYKNLTGTNTDATPNVDATNWVNLCPVAPTPEFLHARMNADENVQVNNNIDNLTILASAGNVGAAGFSAGGGTVTLTAGVTYKLTAALNAVHVANMDYVVYSWYNITAGVNIGNRGFFYAVNDPDNISSQPTAVAYITPTVTTTVDLRIISVGGVTTATIDAEYGYITVEAL
ncbi:hypothetical protein [Owenweeksia hongkongensis]|uniref:hypothetical protein n=1 Tax=Owenweeksia hongkongensis TaxID=253245 RepID=UPI003A914A07